MRRLVLLVTTAGLLVSLAVPALASASSYTIGQREAQWDARDGATARYASLGVNATSSTCRPQGYSYSHRSQWKDYTWHRWVCHWAGSDGQGQRVSGWLRITGHTNGTYGHLPLYGGLRSGSW